MGVPNEPTRLAPEPGHRTDSSSQDWIPRLQRRVSSAKTTFAILGQDWRAHYSRISCRAGYLPLISMSRALPVQEREGPGNTCVVNALDIMAGLLANDADPLTPFAAGHHATCAQAREVENPTQRDVCVPAYCARSTARRARRRDRLDLSGTESRKAPRVFR